MYTLAIHICICICVYVVCENKLQVNYAQQRESRRFGCWLMMIPDNRHLKDIYAAKVNDTVYAVPRIWNRNESHSKFANSASFVLSLSLFWSELGHSRNDHYVDDDDADDGDDEYA